MSPNDSKINALLNTTKNLQAEKGKLKAENYRLAAEIQKLLFIHHSIFWRAIRPLRLMARFTRKVLAAVKRKLNLTHHAPIIASSDNNNSATLPSDIVFPCIPRPVISVIIPVYGKIDYTLRCLKSIANSLPFYPFEIIVMDDASPDDSYQSLKNIIGLRLFRNETNLGFIRNCNKAASFARGEFLLFLNNDCIVTPGWCDKLIDMFMSKPQAGLVGSKFIFPDGMLQEAGSIMWKDASAWNYGCGDNADKPEYNYVKEADYCSGASICIRKTLFEALKGFDEHYLPAYCEDSDLAFKVRAAGYKVLYQPLSCVIHHRGISHGNDVSSGVKAYQLINQEKLYQRWKEILEKENYPNGKNVFLAKDRSFNKPAILFLDYAVPQYDKNAGDKSMSLFLEFFAEAGFNVKLWPQNLIYHPIYTPHYQQMGIEVFYGDEYINQFSKWFDQHATYFDYIFISRPQVAKHFLPSIKNRTKAKILYYGHDIHHLRIQAQNKINTHLLRSLFAKIMEVLEKSVWNNVDIIYYPSPTEYEYVKNHLRGTDKTIRYIPAFYYSPKVNMEHSDFVDRNHLLFVGNFLHTPNVDGIIWFVEKVLPFIHATYPNIILYVIGSTPPPEVIQLQNDHVILTGFVDNDMLQEYYNTCRLSVAPLRYGAGVKGKVVEALSNGLPVVTTSFGAQGIPDAESAMIISDEPEEMARKLIEIYNNAQKWETLSAAAAIIIEKYYSRNTVAKTFSLDIPQVQV